MDDYLNEWIMDRCQREGAERTADLRADWLNWLRDRGKRHAYLEGSAKAFAGGLKRQGFELVKRGGAKYAAGLSLKDKSE